MDAGLVLGAGRRLGLTPSVLAAAEADGLVRWSGGRVGFTCGRLRAAVYDRAPAARRRAAHAALALASAREGRRLVRLVHVALSVGAGAPTGRRAGHRGGPGGRGPLAPGARLGVPAGGGADRRVGCAGGAVDGRGRAGAPRGASGRAAGLLAVARREGGHASVRGRAELVRG